MSNGALRLASGVRIDRLNVTCVLPRDHPSPMAVRSRMDVIIQRQLPSACSRAFAGLCPEDDESVYFVRRLDLDFAVDAGWEPEKVAAVWAAEWARILSDLLGSGDVLRFPDPATYLAQFLIDLADGAAWSKWYYVGFDGLQTLPVSVALRESLTREPVIGEAALLQMTGSGRFDKILRALNDADCYIVLTAFCGADRNGEPAILSSVHLETVRAIAQRSPNLRGEFTSPHRDGLRLYLAVRREAPTVTPTLALLDAVMHSVPRCDSAATTETRTESLFTPFGGVFHLLPRLMEIDFEECAAALPQFAGAAPTSLVRFLVLLKCLGRPRAARAFFDPLLHEIAGVPSDINADEIRAWAREVTPEIVRDFQVRWAASCQKSGVISSRWLCVRSARRGRLLMVADGERNLWLRAVRSVDELSQALQTIHGSRFTNDESPPPILCDPALVSALPPTIAGVPVLAWDSSEAAQHAAEDSAPATCLASTRSPDEDLNYLNLISLLRGARHFDLALSLVARAVLRGFAWRLPGFAWSSPGYLYENFLDVAATIQPEAERWLVILARAPLHIVLAMTGAAQDKYSLPWSNRRQVNLTIAEP